MFFYFTYFQLNKIDGFGTVVVAWSRRASAVSERNLRLPPVLSIPPVFGKANDDEGKEEILKRAIPFADRVALS